MDCKVNDMPPYRRLAGIPKGFNPYHGWQPIEFADPKMADVISTAPVGQALGSLEKDFENSTGKEAVFPYHPQTKKKIMDALHPKFDVALFISRGQILGIFDAVRNLVLNWSLELEKAGVLGEGMSFTAQEKREAVAVTNQYIIQNAGIVGNVSDEAKVTNVQIALSVLDHEAVQSFAAQALTALGQLPHETQAELEPMLKNIQSEIGAAKPKESTLRGLLSSVRTVAEGASGNLVAAGIIRAVSQLLGS
jgi:AbiTii